MHAASPRPLGHLETVLPAALKGAPRRNVTIRMDEGLLTRLVETAEREHRSLSQEIEHRCAGSFAYREIIQTLPQGRYEMVSVSYEGAVVTIQVRRIDATPDHQLETPSPAIGDRP
jgi:hypothetical protein